MEANRTPDQKWAREMLSRISADCTRGEWVRLGAAIKAGLGEEGWQVFDEWSRTASSHYNEADCRRTWDSLSRDGDVTWGTLVQRARAGGWRPAADTARIRQWTIRELDGTPVALHYRRDLPNGDKRTWWGRPDGTRGLGGRRARTLPLYGSELLADTKAKAICIVEGEKAADVLRTAEPTVLVLGTVTGAPTCPTPEVLHSVVETGLVVFLWPDADEPGRRHMDRVAAQLMAAGGAPPSLIVVPGAPEGADAADWAAAGKQPTFEDLTAAAETFKPPEARQRGRPKKSQSQPESSNEDRPMIVVKKGKALEWSREAVRVLVTAGSKDDLRSLFASPVTAAATGELAGGITLLRRQPVATENAASWSTQSSGAGDGALRWSSGELVIEAASPKAVKTKLAEYAEWWKPYREELRPTDPTDQQAGDVIERYRQDCLHPKFPRFRLLNGIVDSPTLRNDGTLLDIPGYDPQSGLFGDFDGSGWNIPSSPTRDDARDAMRMLHELVSETSFAESIHRSVWVAGLLSIVAREYARGNVPLFAVSANQRGAGKGTIVDLASAIATGRPATKWAPPSGRRSDTEAEEDKRLTTVALNGTRVLLYDNVRAGQPIGTPALERAITAGPDGSMGMVSGRVLGKNVEAKAPWRVVVWVTGNNLMTRGDLDRRVVLCRLHTNLEQPENRRFQRISPVDYAIANRREYLIACLTILLAHKRAIDDHEPGVVLEPWGSFVYWSERIRSAVAWADPDGCDPKRTNEEIHEQVHPEQAEALVFFGAWHKVFGSKAVTVKEIDTACHEVPVGSYESDLASAVGDLSLAAPLGNAAVNTYHLGRWLAANKNRPGKFILRQGRRRVGRPTEWYVEKEDPILPAARVAEQVMQDLITEHRKVFPKCSNEDVIQLRERYSLSDEEIQIIDMAYGRDVENRLMNIPPDYDVDGEKVKPLDGMGEAQRRAEHLKMLPLLAFFTIDSVRPKSPAFERVSKRYNALRLVVMGKQNRALHYLNQADWDLGVNADAAALAARAVVLAEADAAKLERGESGIWVFDPKHRAMKPEERRHFVKHVKTEIEKLVYGGDDGDRLGLEEARCGTVPNNAVGRPGRGRPTARGDSPVQ